MRTPTTLLLSALLMLATAACGAERETSPGDDESAGPDPATVKVSVSWVPRSTPEEYENGESLTLSADGIVHEQGQDGPSTEPMDPQEWEDFVADLPDDLEGIEDEETSCTGGGATMLTVKGAGDLDRTVSASVCGGEAPPTAERIDELVADFR